MLCKAVKQDFFPIADSAWEKSPWKNIPAELLQNYMGERPDHFPKVELKITYDDKAICLMFRVEDRYVRSLATAHQQDVYKDSCVEFFFTPGPDLSQGYFNLEMNCGGTMLFHFQPEPRKNSIVIPENDCLKISNMHSLPQIVNPEIKTSCTWTVAYRIPIAILEKYCRVTKPAPQAEWRVNFYKCADDSSHPHWLTWAPVDLPKPNFHHPHSFGILLFE